MSPPPVCSARVVAPKLRFHRSSERSTERKEKKERQASRFALRPPLSLVSPTRRKLAHITQLETQSPRERPTLASSQGLVRSSGGRVETDATGKRSHSCPRHPLKPEVLLYTYSTRSIGARQRSDCGRRRVSGTCGIACVARLQSAALSTSLD
eukprot:scaffold1295_cov220-Pinguiococcus_pyrenoidosus.AAC.15